MLSYSSRDPIEMFLQLTHISIHNLLRISPYSVGMRENADQDKSEYGHLLRSDHYRVQHIHQMRQTNCRLRQEFNMYIR